MKYKIEKKESIYGEVIDNIITENAENMYIVKRDKCYRIRRTCSKRNGWIWDLSKDTYNTPKEAECALLSGRVTFIMGK